MASLRGARLVDISPQGLGRRLGESTRKAAFVGALVIAVSATSGAQAQTCTPFLSPFGGDLSPLYTAGLSAAIAVGSAITAANTAFLTQSTAFVSAPGNPKPDSEGSGIWVRGVGGEANIKTSASINASLGFIGGPPPTTGIINCSSKFRQEFGGFQFGHDVAKLNAMGWNMHIGSTAGYVETKGDIVGGNPIQGSFTSITQVPFVGTYLVATNGGFFVDGLLRFDDIETKLQSPTINIYDQRLDAHGLSASGSLGYHWNFPNSNWFIEPGVGLIYSRVVVDRLNLADATFPGLVPFQGTTQIDPIVSTIGRAGARIGTSFETDNFVLQPFGAVSIWSEFGKNITAKFNTCPGCVIFGITASASITSQNIGTYGQYSLGINGQLKNSGWLGFVRADVREGPRLESFSGTGGIRYQFTPVATANKGLITKAVKAPVERPYDWNGFYLGAFGGAGYGHTRWAADSAPFAAGPQVAGALLGGQVGYNYQSGPWVLGIEADDAWTNATGTTACGPMSPGIFIVPPFFNSNCGDRVSWIATATGRLGYASGRTLYYVKGGAAWDHETFTATCNVGPLNGSVALNCFNAAIVLINQLTASDDRSGWTAGYGIEFGLTPNWSAKGEMDYIDFGNKNLTASEGTVINTGIRMVRGKIGLNYRLNP
jgi:opacity protein-like surface antigen